MEPSTLAGIAIYLSLTGLVLSILALRSRTRERDDHETFED